MLKKSKANFLFLLEITWWVITFFIVVAILLPIYFGTLGYPFYLINSLYIIVLITFTRYIFQLKHTFLAKSQYLKLGLVFLSPIFIFFLTQELNTFQTFLDEQGLEAIIGNASYNYQLSIMKYIYSEMMLFGVGSIISAVLFPLRLILSIWRVHNGVGV